MAGARPRAALGGVGLAAVAAGIALTALGAGSPQAAIPSVQRAAETPQVVDCETRSQTLPGRTGDVTAEVRRKSVLAGPVMFAGARHFERDRSHGDPSRWRGKKAPFIVEAGPAATVTVSRRSRRHALIEVGRDQGRPLRSPSVEFRPCPPDATVGGREVGPRTPFVGGFRVAGRRCVELRVTVDGRSGALVRVLGFGRRDCAKG